MKKITKKTLKGFVVGVIVTTIFMTTAVGAQVKDTIDVIFNSINVSVNGETQDVNNFLYEGTTYVPLRTISEIFDKEVTWDGDTNTASVDDKKISKDDLIIDIGNSTQFTDKEIGEAINLVKENFDFPASKLTKVWYNEEESDKFTKLYLESGRGSVNGVKPDNVIVLLSNFEVGDSGDNSVLNPNSTYENYQWVLIRDNKTSDWEIDDQGY